WTRHFQKEFKTLRGYDMLPYLPVLAGRIVDSREVSNRFLYDFRKTVSDLIADRMYARFAEMAHERGLLVHPESGGPHSAPIDGLKCLGRNDVPTGEFWVRANTHRVRVDERLFIKQSSSAAHIYGKRFVAGEGPTSVGPQWERAPKDLKNVFDRNFCEGINRFFWHCFTNSPKEFGIPGNEYYAGTHLNPNTTWWNKSGAWTRYLSRGSYLLSQGLFQADVCIYYGDDVPNFVLWKRTLDDLGPGYDYDECNAEVILMRMSVKDGNIVLPDGMTYRVLRLPDRNAITLEVLQKIEQMVKNGATIVGPKPAISTGLKAYPESDRKVQEIADKLWGECDGKTITENHYG
ncbi:MAG: glycosyl hydrolase, partial [Bacteroidota bacterium]|nr:glycosyl hydrolase [Bacteroidota bacterium]